MYTIELLATCATKLFEAALTVMCKQRDSVLVETFYIATIGLDPFCQ